MIKCFLYLNGQETKSRNVYLPSVPTTGSFVRVDNSLEQQTYKVIAVEFIDEKDYVKLHVQKASNISTAIK